MLSGLEIKKQIKKGNIKIEPFNENNINSNSYNLRLHEKLLVYTDKTLDMKKPNSVKEIIIPEEGLVLQPGELYLGKTIEHTFTDKYVPVLSGRSSIGRLGIHIHITAGFGDIGFSGHWTLEITVVKPIKIYPNTPICQIYYHPIIGKYELYKSDKYQNNTDVQASMFYKDFKTKESKPNKQ